MSDGPSILIVGRASEDADLTGRLDDEEVFRCDDAYDGLLRMSRRRWPVVVLTGGDPETAALVRAARRLQSDAQIYALCTPAQEPHFRPLVPDILDEYFIRPISDDDRQQIRRATVGLGRESMAADAWVARQFVQFVDAARSVENLERQIAHWVCRLLGDEVHWTEADQLPPGAEPLLLTANDSPRALVRTGSAHRPPPPEAAQAIDALRALLPALMATARRTESLHRLAITDHLTRAYNRRYFYHATDKVLATMNQRGLRATLLLYDIDDFKRYNDTYGHKAGDEILRETAAMMRSFTRAHDIVARIGGDEFAVLFWEAEEPRSPDSQPPRTAFALSHRFRNAVGAHKFPSLGPEAQGTLTISGGLATFPDHGRTCRELLARADEALQQAKESGKNAIYLIGEE